MKVLAVIVNYRTPDLTIRALDCLLAEMTSLPGSRVTIVDNDSRDGSFEKLAMAVSERSVEHCVDVIASDRNGGLGYGLNKALQIGLSTPVDSFFLLNSDAFLREGGLTRLVHFQTENLDAHIVSGYVHGPDGEPHCTCFRFPTILGELSANLRIGLLARLFSRSIIAIQTPNAPAKVDWTAGCNTLIRREVFETIGLFDEAYFLYYEETDFCRRAANAGFQTWYMPSAPVMHIGGASTDFKNNTKPRASYWFDSRRRYFEKHHGRAYAVVSDLVWIVSYGAWQLRRMLQRIPNEDPPRLLRDFVMHSVSYLRASPEQMMPPQGSRSSRGSVN